MQYEVSNTKREMTYLFELFDEVLCPTSPLHTHTDMYTKSTELDRLNSSFNLHVSLGANSSNSVVPIVHQEKIAPFSRHELIISVLLAGATHGQ